MSDPKVFANVGRQTAWLLPVAVAAFALLFWQFASGRLVNAYYMSNPVEICGELGKWIAAGSLWYNILARYAAR